MDDIALLNGRKVLSNARGDLAYHADETLATFQSALDRARDEIDGHATYTVANAAAVLADARKSLDNRANLIVGNAMSVAGNYGIEVPPPDTLRTSRSFPPPEIVAIGTGTQEPTQSLAGLGGGGEQYRPICNVHLIDEAIRGAYVWLCRVSGGPVTVCPEPNSLVSGTIQQIRRYPHWWNAELACRLVNDCLWPLEEVLSYSDAIDATQLYAGQGEINMQQFCSVLPNLFEEWRIWIRNQSPKPSRPGEITGIQQGQTLPDGYCWWCDAQGVKHAYYCTPETIPAGWIRC